MRCAIYTRVSSDPKGIGRSVAEQEQDCRQVAAREGWEVVQVFTDQDRSASRYAKKGRPAYDQLVRFVKDGHCDVLVTWECSRAQRDLEVYVQLRELCRSKGVLWSYSGRTYDMGRTDDRFTTGLDALLAERESDITRERVLRAVRANAVQGRPHGRIPYGYRREYDADTGALARQVIREDQAAVIREAAARVVAGEATNAIAKDFNARGIPVPWGGGAWDLTKIRRLVVNPTYIAQRVHQGKVIGPAEWPPILDEATFFACVGKMNDPSRKYTKEYGYKYLLSGIMTCGMCGGRIKVMPQSGGGVGRGPRKKYKTYICVNWCVSRKVEWVENLVEELLIRRLSMPDASQLFIAPDAGNDVGSQLTDLRARLEGFYDAAARGELTPAALGRIEAKLLPEIEALESQLRRYDVPTVALELLRDPAKVWKSLELTQKREVVGALLEIRLYKSQLPAGSRRFDPETVKIRWRGSDADAQPVPA